jgi:membrane peptidoglycan carboxypeptidase
MLLRKRVLLFGLTGLLLSSLISALLLSGTALATYAHYQPYLTNKNYLVNNNKRGLVLLDRTGEPFYTFHPGNISAYVPLESIPDSFQKALIAAEDRTFYNNHGFSLRGMLRAAYVNATTGQIVQGGSTITQGLVKNVLLSPDRNVVRKFKEVTLAYALTRFYEKPEILEMYANSVYFGAGAIGIEEAAQTYFGIPARDLDLAQSALLVSLLPARRAMTPYSIPTWPPFVNNGF